MLRGEQAGTNSRVTNQGMTLVFSFSVFAGRSGAFAGPEDQHYAVLSAECQHVLLYKSAPFAISAATGRGRNKEPPKGPPAVLRMPLSAALAIFPGPAWPALPRYAVLHDLKSLKVPHVSSDPACLSDNGSSQFCKCYFDLALVSTERRPTPKVLALA